VWLFCCARCFDIGGNANTERRLCGCSLTIHRVEISVVGGKSVMAHRAVGNILDCVTKKFNKLLM
jgi:hypothetical protein